LTLDASSYNGIVIRFSDGVTQNIHIENNMTVTPVDAGITFPCDKGTITYTISDIRGWTFSADDGNDNLWQRSNGISNIATDKPTIAIEASRVILGNLPIGAHVHIISLDGRIISTHIANGTTCEISLSGLSRGVYLLSYSSNNAIKISVAQ
jgi:hypothetical protein